MHSDVTAFIFEEADKATYKYSEYWEVRATVYFE